MAAGKIKVAIVVGIVLLLGVGITVVSLKPSADQPSQSATASPPAQRKLPVKLNFSNGTEIEVLGIQQEPWDEGKWWSADGSEIAAPPHPDKPRVMMSTDDPTMRIVRLMLAERNRSGRNEGLQLNVVPSQMTRFSGYRGPDGRTNFEAFAIIAGATASADLQIGVADGQWTDVATYDIASGQYSIVDHPFHIGNIVEKNNETSVQTYHEPGWSTEKDLSVVVLADSRELQSAHAEGAADGSTGTTDYFKCAKSDITKVIVRTRPYETVTLKNVSLIPTTLPTDLYSERGLTSNPGVPKPSR